MKKKTTLQILVSIILLSAIPTALLAREPDRVLPTDTTIDGTYVQYGEVVTIDGTVDGDAIIIASEIRVNGHITGDLLALGNLITINGNVDGSVRALANELLVRGPIGRNLTAAAATLTLTSESAIAGDAAYAAATAGVSGSIGQNLTGHSWETALSATVGRDAVINVSGTKFTVAESTQIGGRLTYGAAAALPLSPTIAAGGVSYRHSIGYLQQALNRWGINTFVFRLTYFISLLLAGLVLIYFFPRGTEHIIGAMQRKFFVHILWGVAVLVGVPLLISLLLISVIGSALAILLLGVYVVFLFISPVFIGLAVGQRLWHLALPSRTMSHIILLIGGMIVYLAATWLPILGAWISLLGALWFLGSVATRKYRSVKERELPIS